MKTQLLTAIALLCSAKLLGQVYVEAPVTLKATVTSTLETVYTEKGATVSSVVERFSNRELLDECVATGLIDDIVGWSIVVYYDSVMTDIYTGSDPAFRLRHKDGRTIPLDSIITMESIAASGSGKATSSATKVSGSLARRGLYSITIRYQGDMAVFYGAIPFTLKLSGTPDEYYGTSGAVSSTMNGFIEDYFETTIVLGLTSSGFKRK